MLFLIKSLMYINIFRWKTDNPRTALNSPLIIFPGTERMIELRKQANPEPWRRLISVLPRSHLHNPPGVSLYRTWSCTDFWLKFWVIASAFISDPCFLRRSASLSSPEALCGLCRVNQVDTLMPTFFRCSIPILLLPLACPQSSLCCHQILVCLGCYHKMP